MIDEIIIATIFIGQFCDRLDCGMPKESDYVAARQGYVVGFNSKTHCPDWTMEKLTASNLVNSAAGRSEDFREDVQIPTSAKLSGDHGVPMAKVR